jgi:hypothetical protein
VSTDAFATLRRARTIGLRHPKVSAAAALVALHLATYADGKTGTRIYPGNDRIARETGLNERTVRRAITWLCQNGELRRDKPGARGSAACFSYVGGLGGLLRPDSGRIDPPTNPSNQEQDSLTESTESGGHAASETHRSSPAGSATSHPEELFRCLDCGRDAPWLSGGRCGDCIDRRSK